MTRNLGFLSQVDLISDYPAAYIEALCDEVIPKKSYRQTSIATNISIVNTIIPKSVENTPSKDFRIVNRENVTFRYWQAFSEPQAFPEQKGISPSSTALATKTSKYIIFFKESKDSGPGEILDKVNSLLKTIGASEIIEIYDQLNGFSAYLSEEQVTRLSALAGLELSGIENIELDASINNNSELQISTLGRDPITGITALNSYSNQFTAVGSSELVPWGVSAVWQGNTSQLLNNPGLGKYAYIIDTGISNTTNDLNVDTINGWNWINGSRTALDDNGHGTHVAGTIAAIGGNNFGVVGVAAGATVIPLKVLDASGSGTISNIINAINYTLNNISTTMRNISSVVVNLSLAARTTSTSLDQAIISAANKGLRFAVAAGNNGQDVDSFTPARAGSHANVFTASAVNNNYQMASWSNWDQLTPRDRIDNIDYAAPGVNVLSLGVSAGLLSTFSGTSMAAPHLAGLLLTTGITSGGMTTPYYANTADPFAVNA